MEDSWKTTDFVVLSHRDSKDVFILGGTDEIQVRNTYNSPWSIGNNTNCKDIYTRYSLGVLVEANNVSVLQLNVLNVIFGPFKF